MDQTASTLITVEGARRLIAAIFEQAVRDINHPGRLQSAQQWFMGEDAAWYAELLDLDIETIRARVSAGNLEIPKQYGAVEHAGRHQREEKFFNPNGLSTKEIKRIDRRHRELGMMHDVKQFTGATRE